MCLPHAQRNALVLAGVGEPVADESWLLLEDVEHAAFGLFSQLGERALDHLVVRYPQCLHLGCSFSFEPRRRPKRAVSQSRAEKRSEVLAHEDPQGVDGTDSAEANP